MKGKIVFVKSSIDKFNIFRVFRYKCKKKFSKRNVKKGGGDIKSFKKNIHNLAVRSQKRYVVLTKEYRWNYFFLNVAAKNIKKYWTLRTFNSTFEKRFEVRKYKKYSKLNIIRFCFEKLIFLTFFFFIFLLKCDNFFLYVLEIS